MLNKRCIEYKGYLKHQNYNTELVDRQFERALEIERSEILKKKEKTNKKVFPLVLDFNPLLPDAGKIIRKHLHILKSSPHLREIFTPKSIFPAFRRTKNLKELLAPSKCKPVNYSNSDKSENGCFKCGKKCDLCKNFLIEAPKFKSFATAREYHLTQKVGCSSENVIYLASCNKCNLQHVSSTSTAFKIRCRNHKSAMLTNTKTCELAMHFNHTEHSISDIKFIVIDKISNFRSLLHLEQLLLTREAYWTAQLFTLYHRIIGISTLCRR